MRQASKRIPDSAEKTVRDIRRATRRHHSAEEKIRIVLEGLRGEDSIAELCRKEGINQNLYYRWSKEFLDAERARQAERDAAIRAEQAAAESANREVILQGERNAPRDARYTARKAGSRR
jgi:transposase